jgi:NitT/TauT family transport system ATP-binding protein
LELWLGKKIPTRSIFIVTHNIEEAVLLADRIMVLGKNPGRLRTDFQVTMPHPRDRKSAGFLQLVDYIYKVLTRPDTEPAAAPALGDGAVKGPAKYQMLPHARPGGIAGLLELLADRGGHYDVYHLADELSFEIDELLPIVEAAHLLGFVRVSEGDVEITAAGTEFANAGILERKQLFRQAATANITLIRQIARALASKSNREISDEFFHDTLDEHFSEEETRRQLETAIHWGRYAELFDHDAVKQRFFLPEAEPAHAAVEISEQ